MKDVVSYDKWMNEKELFIIEARKFGVDTTEVETPIGIQFKYGNTRVMFKIWLASANRDGYKLVPVEPTQKMVEKFTEVYYQDTYASECSLWVDDETIKLGYKAMIGADE